MNESDWLSSTDAQEMLAFLLKDGKASEAGNIGEIGDLQPGVTKTLRLNLKPGHYALICNLPGHYAAGQRADFVVK